MNRWDDSQDDGEATAFVMPTPGGRGRQPGSAAQPMRTEPAQPAAVTGSVNLPNWAETGSSPLLAAAAPLLALATRLRTLVEEPNISVLRDRIIEAMRGFEKVAQARGTDRDTLRISHYALCAFIDDIVLNTPWGGHSSWAKQSIVSTFHTDVTGGDRFYDLLNRLQSDPGRFGPVLELMYYCLSLGFEGRMRVLQRGPADHARIRDSVYSTIRQMHGDYERELSPHWRGVAATHRPLVSYIPVWVLGIAAAAVLVMLYLSLGFALNGHSDAVAYQMATLPPEGMPVVTVVDPPAPKVALVEPPPVAKPEVVASPSSTVVAFRRFLDQEIKDGLVDVSETRQAVTVRLVGDGMFDSGSATVKAAYLPTLERVAQALNDQTGEVLITGHTDNVPIARTIRFQSNFALSLARADAVRDFIGHRISTPARIRTEGKAEWVPIASNVTPEGRQKNRRIELMLLKTGDAPQ